MWKKKIWTPNAKTLSSKERKKEGMGRKQRQRSPPQGSVEPPGVRRTLLRTSPVKPVLISSSDSGELREGVRLNPLQSDEDVHIEKGRVTGRYARYRTLNVFVLRPPV